MKRILWAAVFFLSLSSLWAVGKESKGSVFGTVFQNEIRFYSGSIGGKKTDFRLVFDRFSSRTTLSVLNRRGESFGIGAQNIKQLSFSFSRSEKSLTGSFDRNGHTVLFSGEAWPFFPSCVVRTYRYRTERKGYTFSFSWDIPYFTEDLKEVADKMTQTLIGDENFAELDPYDSGDGLLVYFSRIAAPELKRWEEDLKNGHSYDFEKTVSTEVLFANRNLLSVRLSDYTLTEDIPGVTNISGFVFDRSSGNRLREDFEWLDISQPQWKQDVRKHLMSGDRDGAEDPFDGNDPVFDASCQWAVTPSGILFVWSGVQFPELPAILFPFSDIQPYINKKIGLESLWE